MWLSLELGNAQQKQCDSLCAIAVWWVLRERGLPKWLDVRQKTRLLASFSWVNSVVGRWPAHLTAMHLTCIRITRSEGWNERVVQSLLETEWRRHRDYGSSPASACPTSPPWCSSDKKQSSTYRTTWSTKPPSTPPIHVSQSKPPWPPTRTEQRSPHVENVILAVYTKEKKNNCHHTCSAPNPTALRTPIPCWQPASRSSWVEAPPECWAERRPERWSHHPATCSAPRRYE